MRRIEGREVETKEGNGMTETETETEMVAEIKKENLGKDIGVEAESGTGVEIVIVIEIEIETMISSEIKNMEGRRSTGAGTGIEELGLKLYGRTWWVSFFMKDILFLVLL